MRSDSNTATNKRYVGDEDASSIIEQQVSVVLCVLVTGFGASCITADNRGGLLLYIHL